MQMCMVLGDLWPVQGLASSTLCVANSQNLGRPVQLRCGGGGKQQSRHQQCQASQSQAIHNHHFLTAVIFGA